MKEINEKIMKEIEIGASHMGVSTEELVEKYRAICKENGMEVDNDISVSLLRNYVRGNMPTKKGNNNSGSNSLVKSAFGFFVSLEAPRDMMSWNRNLFKMLSLHGLLVMLSHGLRHRSKKLLQVLPEKVSGTKVGMIDGAGKIWMCSSSLIR